MKNQVNVNLPLTDKLDSEASESFDRGAVDILLLAPLVRHGQSGYLNWMPTTTANTSGIAIRQGTSHLRFDSAAGSCRERDVIYLFCGLW